MNKKTKMNVASVFAVVFSFLAHGQVVMAQGASSGTGLADELKVVMTKISGIGSQNHNTSARPVGVSGVEMLVTGTGDRFQVSKSGQFERVDSVAQLALMLPSKPSNLSFLQELCIDRIKSLQSGSNGRQAIEVTFEGKRIGTGSFLVTKLLGCADVTKTAAIVAAKPTPKPTPKPKPVSKK
jgi:hypothetical protein